MPLITLKDHRFHVAGFFARGAHATIVDELVARGGVVSSAIDGSLTALIAGRACNNARNKALIRGVPILDEHHLTTLLEEGSLTLEVEQAIPATSDISKSIAKLRSLFDGPPNSATWTRCLTILEQCDDAHQDTLVEYVKPFVARWDGFDMSRWKTPSGHPLMSGLNKSRWFTGLPDDELRVMPPLWLTEMLSGTYHPKHALGRVVNVHRLRTNGSQLETLLRNPYLTNMTTLVLGVMNSYSKRLFMTLCTHDNARTLKHLYVDLNSVKTREHFLDTMARGDHTLDALTHLHLRISGFDLSRRNMDLTKIRNLPPFEKAHVEVGDWNGQGWKVGTHQES